ncbi:unnamed protein product [Vitrella brassicaformis CCMP3155]|uniref:Tr-type G domain-containing protein n=2 Tax=Vitrella brassicaformis TaxID=1169539 RepID=A0A0G4EBI8_VITBC|nr:unnamed protein product [Vitrella brassicaformis CCMP3155]|eukprot:CEL92887.1 unnamed protein product [Vitrella brassicaformis CCMP3155]
MSVFCSWPRWLVLACATVVQLSQGLQRLSRTAFMPPLHAMQPGRISANMHRRSPHWRMAAPAAVAEKTVEETTVKRRADIRNIAIIAHVDHGKTTLVDAMLQQAAVFREGQQMQERVMDSNDQERERGITILAKNTAINYKGTKINLVDTPGHADFGGEVERIMNMVDGVLLVVDSVEGPKPQTRFVLKKALEAGCEAVVVVNKCDRPAARPEVVIERTFDLFLDLDASEEQLEFQAIYASALKGQSGWEPDQLQDNMECLFEAILKLPGPVVVEGNPLQMMIANVDYDTYKGRLAIGRLQAGSLKPSMGVGLARPGEAVRRGSISELFMFNNLGRTAVEEATAGDIVMFSGLSDFTIGDTVVDPNNPQPLVPIKVEEPTVRMSLGVNKSPLVGKDPDGKLLTSAQIRDRLVKELDKNVALKVDFEGGGGDSYEVSGRGQMHLTVLIENMRREGFEMTVGPPTVIIKEIDGEKCEPWEGVEITVPENYMGGVVQEMQVRKSEMVQMHPANDEGNVCLEYLMPTRASIGLRSQLLTLTRGTALIDSTFDSYRKLAGDISPRERGSLLASETGKATSNGILNAQVRGNLFVSPGTEVYKGMIVGMNAKPDDLKVNVCKEKALTNVRSATKTITEGVVPPIEVTLDSAVEYIGPDEVVEVTPNFLRMAKRDTDAKIGKRK